MLNLAATEDVELLRETTARFLAQTCDLAVVRELADDPVGFSPDWWRQGAQLGWTSLLIPDEYGGAAAGGACAVELATLAEQLGRMVSPGPFLPCNVVAAAVAAAGSDEQRAAVLGGLARGDLVATWCPPMFGAAAAVRAAQRDGGFVLSGTSPVVEAAAQAQWLLVSCDGTAGPTQFLLPVGTPGVEIVALEGLDLVRRFAEVRFHDVETGPEQLVGDFGLAAAAIESQIQLALVLQCAETAGVADRVLEFTIEWAFDRYTFGRPLASYQALKHRFADMKLWSESIQATTQTAAIAVAQQADDAHQLVRVAKSYVGDRALELIQDCVQLHGGMGVTWEHDLHLYLRRATVNRNLYGTPREHRVALTAGRLEAARSPVQSAAGREATQGSDQGTSQAPAQGSENGTIQAPAQGSDNGTVQAPAQGSDHGTVQAPAQGSDHGPASERSQVPDQAGSPGSGSVMSVRGQPRSESSDIEDVESFRMRARAWLAENMPTLGSEAPQVSSWALDQPSVDRARSLQRRLFEGGFAGLVFPRAYGGQGLTPAHQHAFNEETVGYEMPSLFNIPTLSIIAPTLLEFGTEEQKRRHIAAILRGDELWVQFLSEPSGGSDLAGAVTRADFDGDAWVLNGAKTWSTFAIFCDYAMCLARTDWDVPKHGGLTMFVLKIDQPGVDVAWIRQSNGGRDFCEEFFSDVRLDADSVIGEVNGGWAVASGLLNHERGSGGSSVYAHDGGGGRVDSPDDSLVDLFVGMDTNEPHLLDLLGEAHTLRTVHQQLSARVADGMQNGHFSPVAGALLRMSNGLLGARRATIGMEIAAASSVAWRSGDPTEEFGSEYLFRQANCLGGGSTEMQRNIISERLLGMPRERSEDRNRPFREVPRTGR